MNDDDDTNMTDEGPFDGLLSVLSYATAPTAELYVAVMDAALDARDKFRLQLRPSDVASAVGVDRDAAAAALNYLADHGVLHRTYDPSEAETLAEYYKGAFLYQLTPAGIAAHRGVRDVLATKMAAVGRLSASLLPRIHEALLALAGDAEDGDDSRLKADLTALFALVAELADSAATYLRELDAQVNDLAADSWRLSAYKTAVLTYLDKFNRELGHWTPRIVDAIDGLDALDSHALLLRAGRVDAAPRPDGTFDGGPVDDLVGRWAGTVGWFCPRPGRQATVEYVTNAMVGAINRVLGAISRLHDRRMRRVSREGDFVQLANWFADATPKEAHQLWDATTGLWPARHFRHAAGDNQTDRRKSFWDAGRAELEPRVRTSTKRGSPGRPGRRSDYAVAKRVARDRAQAAAAQAAAARSSLARRTPARLSDLKALDVNEFAAFLEIVSAALAEVSTDGVRVAVLPGATIRLRRANNAATATLITPTGTFTGPDDLIEIELAGAAGAAEAVS
jgi:uncharacterized protein (TIGR02677 family)